MLGNHSEPLSSLEVLVLDCQATAAAPKGHLLEIGWARVRDTVSDPHARLIALPEGARIPPAVSRITGISQEMLGDAVPVQNAWHALTEHAATLTPQPAPTVIHFAPFETPFLHGLVAGPLFGDVLPLDIVCTRDIARRLLPDLPRCSLRALAGYFGRPVGALRRSADHVEATAFVWQALVLLLEERGVSTWALLREWLAQPAVKPTTARRRGWPMPRELRLSLPHAPGIYRMLRTDGSVLYVGKAASLHHRVNSYFRKQRGVKERALEMLSQARGLSFEITPTALEAALLESDEIKHHRPPYNKALMLEHRALWFASPDLAVRSTHLSVPCRLGPFPSGGTLDDFDALAAADRRALGSGRWAPNADTFAAGYAKLCAAHPELSRADLGAHDRLLRLGTRLWSEGRRDRDLDEDDEDDGRPRVTAWTPESVQMSIEWIALRAAHARRRAIWLTRLVDASLVWREPDDDAVRLMVIENGNITLSENADAQVEPPIPPGYRRPVEARREAFTLASFDRLRVLTTELKRLVAAGAPVAVRFGPGRVFDTARLTAALWWV